MSKHERWVGAVAFGRPYLDLGAAFDRLLDRARHVGRVLLGDAWNVTAALRSLVHAVLKRQARSNTIRPTLASCNSQRSAPFAHLGFPGCQTR
jgi:hypothetical protein